MQSAPGLLGRVICRELIRSAELVSAPRPRSSAGLSAPTGPRSRRRITPSRARTRHEPRGGLRIAARAPPQRLREARRGRRTGPFSAASVMKVTPSFPSCSHVAVISPRSIMPDMAAEVNAGSSAVEARGEPLRARLCGGHCGRPPHAPARSTTRACLALCAPAQLALWRARRAARVRRSGARCCGGADPAEARVLDP